MTAIPGSARGGREWLPTLDIDDPGMRSRGTVLLRLLLVIPHLIALWFLAIAAAVVMLIAWFCALFTGRLPGFAAGFLGGCLAWQTRVDAYAMLLVDDYPPFAFRAADYPVRIGLRPGGRLNRLAVFFRVILAIPASIVQSVLTTGWWAVSFISWLVVLITGRNPEPLFDASAAIVRYTMRFQAYLMMLSPAYPKRLFGEVEGEQIGDGAGYGIEDGAGYGIGDGADGGFGGAPSGTVRTSSVRPLYLSANARVLLIVFIVIGVMSSFSASVFKNW